MPNWDEERPGGYRARMGFVFLQALTADERVSILWCPTGFAIAN
jgi:hypothetical protein